MLQGSTHIIFHADFVIHPLINAGTDSSGSNSTNMRSEYSPLRATATKPITIADHGGKTKKAENTNPDAGRKSSVCLRLATDQRKPVSRRTIT